MLTYRGNARRRPAGRRRVKPTTGDQLKLGQPQGVGAERFPELRDDAVGKPEGVLTRQVAANDAGGTGYANLGEYDSERGESPGVWLGSGLAALDGGPRPGDVVREAQMVALFGHGRHPNADALAQAAAANGTEVDTGLGQPFAVRAASSEFRRELARRIVAHNRERGARTNAPVQDEVRAQLRTERSTYRYTPPAAPPRPQPLPNYTRSPNRTSISRG